MSKGKTDFKKVLQAWTERDLTADAAAGKLEPAFEVDGTLRRLDDVLQSERGAILSGESGVGKTAIARAYVRRALETPSSPLYGKRVLQFSLRVRAASMAKPGEQLRPAFQELVDALTEAKGEIVPYFRDIDLAYSYDLESLFSLLATRLEGPILGEGGAQTVAAMMEATPELEEHYVRVPVHEPSFETMERIAAQWVEARSATRRYAPDAVAMALELCHRFLARSHMPRKVLDFLGAVAAQCKPGRTVDTTLVLDRFHETYHVPRALIDPDVRFDPDETERAFRADVLGQDEAVRTVVRVISLIKAGLSDPRKPFGVFLFVGPTGVGKTHIAQLLAQYLFGTKERLVRINMADFGSPESAATVFGDPTGYTLSLKRGVLTSRLSGHPFGVLLLDELEKAHTSVHDRCLQLLDEGAFINGAGETVPCRSLIIIATSNAGAEIYRGNGIGFSGTLDASAMDRELDRLVYKHFRFEFLNRFDHVVRFRALGRDDIRTIALREIDQLEKRSGLRSRSLTLDVDEGVLDYLTAHGYDPHFGARFLKRTIERTLTTAIAEFLVRAPLRAGSRIAVRVRGNDVVATNAREPTVDKTRVRVAARTDASPKTLDRAALLRETQLLVARARPLRDRLAARREEAQALLARINAEGFWQELATANAIMDDYRGLDVAIRVESRLDGPLVHLEACIAEDAKVKVDVLAQKYDAARRALVDWEARAAEGGARAVWIVIANADVRSKSDAWLPALAAIEMAWCARLGLTVESVAFAIRDERVTHIVLEAEGPGASTYLAAEGGIHRRHGTTRDPERARIDVFEARLEAVAPPPASSPASAAAPARVPGKATAGPFDVKGAWSAALTIGANHVTFAAADAAALARFMRDAVAAHPFEGVAELVRTYGQDGTAARDVITGATIARWRDVERGAFEPLLDARRADATRPDA